MSNWSPLSRAVDRFLLGGRLTPGIAEITGASSPRKWEERDGYGWSGAWLIFRGIGLSHFQIRFSLYEQVDWDDWNAFQPIVAKPPRGRRPRSLDIVHPLTAQLGIRAVVIEDVLQAEQTDHGVWVIPLKVIDWRHPKYTLARPEAASAAPVDPIDQQILDNRSQIEALEQELARPARR